MPQAVIMAGGQGERFWPMTHGQFPKYRIRLNSKESLLQKTYRRLLKIYRKDSIHVVTTQPHFRHIREELPDMRREHILIEPSRNNTAAAIFLSCEMIRRKFGDSETASFFPADHLIQNGSEFKKTLLAAIRLAEAKDVLVTVGIRPVFAATGYGYIESGKKLAGFSESYRVKHFVEKPNLRKATEYLRRRDFLWNSGIFTWKVGVFAKAMDRFSPEYSKRFNLKHLSSSYKKLPKLSIDYALMEKADQIAVVRTCMDWCDIGNWDMYFQKLPADESKNYLSGKTQAKECSRSLLLNHTDQPLITLGINDLIVVKTALGTLICQKGRAEEAALLFRKMNA